MLQIQDIRNNLDEISGRLSKRGQDFSSLLKTAIEKDDVRKETQTELDSYLAEINQASKQIGALYKEGKREEADQLKEKVSELKSKTKDLDEKLKAAELEVYNVLTQIPNAPGVNVPAGKSENDNKIMSTHGEAPVLSQNLPHWELASKYDLIDFELGVKITGAGFPVYKGKGARLQRALINWFLDRARDEGFEEVLPPILVNEDSGFGTGQLPDKEGQMYHVTGDNLYVIPTAEVPITNMYRDVILNSSDLPIKNCGYTPCFRREAGSYGKDVRGLNRLHQFDKVEIVQIVNPKESYDVLESMQKYVQSLLRDLGLHYRVLLLCGGDTGFASAMTYDMEVWSAAQERWLEVSSVSNFESFQANRLKLRVKDEEGNKVLAHTLNGSALALPRILAALLENNQSEEGIRVPEVLVPYCGFDLIS
ncbi:serine--tRNA ligase [bacterium]|nr:serine--tRNA ligase [bacterium]